MYENLTLAGLFLISTLFDLYILVLVVRLILAFTQANSFNPVVRLIIKLTQRLVSPIRRVIPNIGRLETATLVLIILFEIIKILLLGLVATDVPNLGVIFYYAVFSSIRFILKTFFYAILLQAILSWFQQGNTPATEVLQQITAPVLRPLQRVIPTMNGIDISPIPALIILQLLIILLP